MYPTPSPAPESRGTIPCDRCGRHIASADAIHVVEASIEPCPEFPGGWHSAFDLCEACFDRCEMDATRYEVPNIIIDGKWEVM